MAILPKFFADLIHSNKNPSKIFVYIDEIILKLIWKDKGTRTDKITLKKNSEFGGITLPDFKIYYKSTVIKIVWY